MQKKIIIAIVLLLSLFVLLTLFRQTAPPTSDIETGAPQPVIPIEDTVHAFFDDLLLLAPPAQDEGASTRVYESLSTNTQTILQRETIAQDIAPFIGIQDTPRNVSVLSVENIENDTAIATVQLSYTGSESTRLVQLVREGEIWKIDSVKHETPEQAPLTPPVTTEPITTPSVPDDTDTGTPTPIATGPCYVGGCSGEVCSETPPGNFATTCLWEEWYMCFRNATCERQTDGTCGWTQTESLQTCLADKRSSR